jgi:hypothetical protein
MCDKSAYREAPPTEEEKRDSLFYREVPPEVVMEVARKKGVYNLGAKPPQDPLELLAKSAMVKKKVDADRLEERKRAGEYMKILKDGVR